MDEAKKLAAEITDKDEKRLIILGKKMIANYGCMSCHMINGAEDDLQPLRESFRLGTEAGQQARFRIPLRAFDGRASADVTGKSGQWLVPRKT